MAPAAAAGSGPGVIAANAFDGLSDLTNISTTPDCAGLTQRPCGEPADPWVGVSDSHVLQVVNWRVRVTDRTGGGGVGRSTAAWFGVTPISEGRLPFDTDGRVLYDSARDRWIASNLAFDCTGSVVTLMVSNASNGSPLPLTESGWTRYRFAFPGEVADFPTLGASADLVGIGVNRYPVSCVDPGDGTIAVQPVFGRFRAASLLVVDWDALLAHPGTLPWQDLGPALDPAAVNGTPALFTFAPARQIGGARLHVVVAAKTTPSATLPLGIGYTAVGGSVGDGGAGSTLSAGPIAIVPGAALAKPRAPMDPKGMLPQAVDFRITDSVWRANRLAFASTASPGGSATRPRARVIELVTDDSAPVSSAALAQVLTAEPAGSATDTFMPGVTYAYDGTLWAVYSQSGASAYISTFARRQLRADRATEPGAGTWSAGAARVAIGRDAYAGINRRWGDSVGVAPDPLAANAGSAWQAAQFADLLEGWATFVARLDDDAAPPPVPGGVKVQFWPGHTVGTASVPLVLSWNAVGDPGSGVARYEAEVVGSGDIRTVAAGSSSGTRSVRIWVPLGVSTRLRVRAVDYAGQASGWRTTPRFTASLVTPTKANGVTFYRTWTRSTCGSCLAGATRWARRATSRATLTVTARAIAWVTTTGPIHGSARVRYDGVSAGTVSTHASAIRTRVVAAARTWTSVGRHKISVEVRGTARHPRIDVDAFLVLR